MILWIYTCRTLVTLYQKDLDVCIMQQGVKFTEVWHVMWLFTSTLIWYHKHINTRTQRHTAHFGASRMIHLYKSILTPRACAHSSYLYYFEYVVHCISKIYSPECLFFFLNYLLAKVIYLLIRCYKTRFILRNKSNTDRNGVNKQNTHTTHTTHTHQALLER